MTDEEILKRLAEIECPDLPAMWRKNHNPIENPADTYALIEKNVDLIQRLDPYEHGDPKEEWRVCCIGRSYGPSHESLATAVCLAVIEATTPEGE